MPPITAILHTHNDAASLGRALESLRPCDEMIVVDHGSTDATLRVAREYGAIIYSGRPGEAPSAPLASARFDWVLYLLPSESLTEDLEASLYEWKLRKAGEITSIAACSTLIKEETPHGWREASPSTRLVPRTWNQWNGYLPRDVAAAELLRGELLRFQSR